MDALEYFDESDHGSLLSDALDALRFSLEQLNAPNCQACFGYGEIDYEIELAGGPLDISPPTTVERGVCSDCLGIGRQWWFKPGGTA